jgi:hypothetical protein
MLVQERGLGSDFHCLISLNELSPPDSSPSIHHTIDIAFFCAFLCLRCRQQSSKLHNHCHLAPPAR